MLVGIANREDPDQTAFFGSSLIWVCIICLGLFHRHFVFKILEHLSFNSHRARKMLIFSFSSCIAW